MTKDEMLTRAKELATEAHKYRKVALRFNDAAVKLEDQVRELKYRAFGAASALMAVPFTC